MLLKYFTMANVFKYNSTGFCNKVIKYSLNWAQIVSACVIKFTIMIFTLLKCILFLKAPGYHTNVQNINKLSSQLYIVIQVLMPM